MTYLGIGRNELKAFQTLVVAQNDEEARTKVLGKFRHWWGGDCEQRNVQIRAFGDGRLV